MRRRPSDVLTRTLAGFGFIILACGSALMVGIALGIGTEPIATPEQSEGAALALFYVWPLTVALALLFGAIALRAARRQRIMTLIIGGVLMWGSVEGALYLISAIIPGGARLPMTGGAAIAVIAVFLAVDSGAAYWTWRVLRSGDQGPMR